MSFAHSIINNPKSWGRKPEPEKLDPDTGLNFWVPAVPALTPLPTVTSISTNNGIVTYCFDGGFVVHYYAAHDTVEVIDTVCSHVTTYPMAFLMANPGNAPLDIMERLARQVAEDVTP